MFKKTKIFAKKTPSLKTAEIKRICQLKSTEWPFEIEKQYDWFNKQIKKKDIHILLIKKKNLIGYTCLRYKNFFSKKKKISFLLFDTHIIKKSLRNKGLGKILITKAIRIIKKKNIISLLFCGQNHLKYYRKYNWNIINKKKYLCNKNYKKKYLMYIGKKFLFKKKITIKI